MEAGGGKESDEDSPESSAESGLDRSMKAVTGLCQALDRRVSVADLCHGNILVVPRRTLGACC